MSKKVLLVAYACSPHKGSEEGRGWSWATGLAKRGYQVHCLTNFEDRKAIQKKIESEKIENLKFNFISLPFGLDRLLFRQSSIFIYFHYFIWKKKAAKIAQELHEINKFNIAHHVTYGSLQQGSCIYNLRDCKKIFGPIGGGQMALPVFKQYFKIAWLNEVLRKFISNLFFLFSSDLNKTLVESDHIIATNYETKDLIAKKKPSVEYKVDVTDMYPIPNSYNELEHNQRFDSGELNIIWVGRLIPRKGLNLSLHALSFLPKDINYKIKIIGDGPLRKKVPKWIRKYDLDPKRIQHLGRIPYNSMIDHYRKADILLFCSLRDTLGIQVMEAMVNSLPLIVLNLSGCRNLVPENSAIKIDPAPRDGTAKSIAKSIIQLYRNIDFRKKMAKNAYDYAIKSTWDKRINDIIFRYYLNE